MHRLNFAPHFDADNFKANIEHFSLRSFVLCLVSSQLIANYTWRLMEIVFLRQATAARALGESRKFMKFRMSGGEIIAWWKYLYLKADINDSSTSFDAPVLVFWWVKVKMGESITLNRIHSRSVCVTLKVKNLTKGWKKVNCETNWNACNQPDQKCLQLDNETNRVNYTELPRTIMSAIEWNEVKQSNAAANL